jgi:carbon storage regulator CsrA
MLVLSRRENSSIKIGSDVTVTVLSARRNQVRLGIEAPKDVRILRDELVEPFEEHKELSPTDVGQQRRTPGMKIVLVIEDDPLHARLIRKSLCSSQGTMVTVAETAKLALDALAGASNDLVHPDLILLDMHLPDSTGLDVLRSIRRDERLRRIPVVMLSCCQEDTVVDECMESGANAFVVKSARWEDFRSSVSRIGDFWTNDYFAPPSNRLSSPPTAQAEIVI